MKAAGCGDIRVLMSRAGCNDEGMSGLAWLGAALLLWGALSVAAQPSAQRGASGAGAGGGRIEVTSGLGRTLYALPDDQAVLDARRSLAGDGKSVELVLKLAQAEAGRRQYREAVATATKGLAFAPDNAALHLERGHRELGLREFKEAGRDLQEATRLAPTMLDAWYHLGLAYYFLGEFREAAASFERARALAKSDDSLIDCTNWLYVSLRRAGEEPRAAQALARITPAVKNTEPHLFFYLRLLHFYQGRLTAQAVLPPRPRGPADVEGELSFDTVSYGVGNWDLYHGERADAARLFEQVVQGEAWNSWGFIGAEVELERMGEGGRARGRFP